MRLKLKFSLIKQNRLEIAASYIKASLEYILRLYYAMSFPGDKKVFCL